ncbi:hypothetical protein HanRHA438_Chr01g0013041 [Helianthus annuus]|nr:hypothetical protein HanRHA438_Chr01g0013041 [Helianthus annuus]
MMSICEENNGNKVGGPILPFDESCAIVGRKLGYLRYHPRFTNCGSRFRHVAKENKQQG